MTTTFEVQIAELYVMKGKELQKHFRQVMGDTTSSRNADYMRRRIAYRLQQLAEGSLSMRAQQRAAEIADEANIRQRSSNCLGKYLVKAPLGQTAKRETPDCLRWEPPFCVTIKGDR